MGGEGGQRGGDLPSPRLDSFVFLLLRVSSPLARYFESGNGDWAVVVAFVRKIMVSWFIHVVQCKCRRNCGLHVFVSVGRATSITMLVLSLFSSLSTKK